MGDPSQTIPTPPAHVQRRRRLTEQEKATLFSSEVNNWIKAVETGVDAAAVGWIAFYIFNKLTSLSSDSQNGLVDLVKGFFDQIGGVISLPFKWGAEDLGKWISDSTNFIGRSLKSIVGGSWHVDPEDAAFIAAIVYCLARGAMYRTKVAPV